MYKCRAVTLRTLAMVGRAPVSARRHRTFLNSQPSRRGCRNAASRPLSIEQAEAMTRSGPVMLRTSSRTGRFLSIDATQHASYIGIKRICWGMVVSMSRRPSHWPTKFSVKAPAFGSPAGV